MSTFTFNCPHCQQSLEAPEEMLGTSIDCPSCANHIQLPDPQPSSSEPPPAAQKTKKKFVLNNPKASTPGPPRGTRPCPFCGEDILAVAIKCKHCGSGLRQIGDDLSRVGSLGLLSGKIRSGVLITAACLSIVAFFLPNVVITAPFLGKANVSMYDVASAFVSNPKGQDESPGRHTQKVAKEAIDSFKITEAGAGRIICAVAILGVMLHYLLSVAWCGLWLVTRRGIEVVNKVWLIGAIQFPVLFTIGISIVFASMKSDMAKNADGGLGAAMGAAMVSAFSIDAGLIMWVLSVVALLGLIMPMITRKLASLSSK